VAVVLVTHDRDVAARANRQIVMRDGLIVESNGAPPPRIPRQRRQEP
jgi:putative ABC transport system ATP-binding protein